MLLAIDAGNTNIVFALHDGEKWRGNWRISTNNHRTSDEYGAWLTTLLEKQGISSKQITRAIIGTVVPAALYHLRLLCRAWLDLEPLIANSRSNWGLGCKVDTPDEVGVDRRLNGLAAHHMFGGPLVVVDFGTATTFDVVDAEGAFCGGAIAPGVNLSLEALHQAAARLPRISVGRPTSAIGRNTIVSMRSGLFWGYVGLVEGIVSQIKAEMKTPLAVIATGGLAPLFSEGTSLFQHVALTLTLDGLRLLADRNPSQNAIDRDD
ncbi:type III pantothenate kinase [Candidatus Kirkpatrickella diaphorinae]|uniref:Type III pantothenate kinase n=1 Tax=Candidatus Kirkpatrickella diaphorinae TaxID=2984322 RepID=A0ABY6GJN3_9PROT|nr:type III pantothenate kinase [Candidatus Kirkpatrickella diaphorinae]UYH51738.1 type III pantothenate kinase [Candidatus Kirkpatrickella diaphorinae]